MIQENNITEKIDRADELIKHGQLIEAIACLQEIHELHPNDESVVLRLAWAYWDNGNKQRSVEYWKILLDRELQRKVFTGFAYDELVRIYKQEEQIESLVAICEKAARVQPEDIGLLKELGTAYLLAGRSEKSCETFKTLTSMEPDNPAFYCLLGEACLAAGKNQEFENAYRQAGIIDPDDADRYLFQAAGLCMKKGLFNEARELLINCLELSPSNSLYYCSLGDLLVAINEIPDAFAQYEKACEYNPPHAAAYLNRLGISLMRAEYFDNAVKAFESALSFDASTPCLQHLEEARQASGRCKKHPVETENI